MPNLVDIYRSRKRMPGDFYFDLIKREDGARALLLAIAPPKHSDPLAVCFLSPAQAESLYAKLGMMIADLTAHEKKQ